MKDILLYFARFPRWEGLHDLATNSVSEIEGYTKLKKMLDAVGPHSLLPEIDHFVFGQSFEQLRSRIERLAGTFLMIDFGEIDISSDGHRSILADQRVAVTVATRMSDHADNLEEFLISDHTLALTKKIYARLLQDAENGDTSFITREYLFQAEFIPFQASELSASGWTLMLNCKAPL